MKTKKVKYEDIIGMFFDKFEPPCKKGERFKMDDGKNYICTESTSNAFEYHEVGNRENDMRLFRF